MKHNILLAFIIGLFLIGCTDEPFGPEVDRLPDLVPSELVYFEVGNAREFSAFITRPPSFDSDGFIPEFSIVRMRDNDGNEISMDIVNQFVSIDNAIEDVITVSEEDAVIVNGDTIRDYSVFNTADLGRVRVSDGNPFSFGTYSFDIQMSITDEAGGETVATTFSNALEVFLGPQIATGLIYIPSGQNLIVGEGQSTTEPLVFGANPDFRFELGDNTDKLNINPGTGALSLVEGFTPSEEPEEIMPTINVVSNITEELVSFSGVVTVYASVDPFDVPKATVTVFYPTFRAAGSEVGGYFIRDIVNEPNRSWRNLPPNITPVDPRPEANADNQRRLEVNLVNSPNAQTPFDSWCILNSQDFRPFEFGFDMEAEFYLENRFVEFLQDGSVPSNIQVYISTDFIGDFGSATFEDVSDQLMVTVSTDNGGTFEGSEFVGLPLPGPGDTDDKPVRCTLNLNEYVGMENVTFAFRVFTTFTEGTISNGAGEGRSGRYIINDFNITATEQ